MSKAVRVVYLGGLGRSGSTLLERVLGQLPGVCPAGEVVHMWQRGVAENERCGCGKAFGACDFSIKVGKAAFGGWENVSTDRIIGLRATVDRTRRIPSLARRSLPARLQYADLSGRGKRVRFLYFPDENHWILKPGDIQVWYETVFAFLAENVLGEGWRRPDLL